MRHIWNFRRKARGRPHNGQRLYFRTGNLGFRRALTMSDVFATFVLLFAGPALRLLAEGESERLEQGPSLIVRLGGRPD
jgi:hypothetical protein